jgi:hypothetical protein
MSWQRAVLLKIDSGGYLWFRGQPRKKRPIFIARRGCVHGKKPHHIHRKYITESTAAAASTLWPATMADNLVLQVNVSTPIFQKLTALISPQEADPDESLAGPPPMNNG